MAERIVGGLQFVEVHHHQEKRRILALRDRHRARQLDIEEIAVAQTRQRVVKRQTLQIALGRGEFHFERAFFDRVDDHARQGIRAQLPLRQIIMRAPFHRLDGDRLVAAAGQHDERHGAAQPRAQFDDKIEPVDIRQAVVHQDAVEGAARGQFDALAAVAGFFHSITRPQRL